MVIDCDAIGYESLGKMLAEKGWSEYFLTGPNREPFYPLLVSVSMRIGAFFSFSYQPIQVLLQLSILFIAQLMTLRILRLLNINDWISAFTILYLGFSPAILNSALSLFSEISTYPLILAIILLSYRSWISFSGRKRKIALLAIASGLAFFITTLNKAIFEIITPAFTIMFFLSTLLVRSRRFVLNALMYAVVLLCVFYALITGYKFTNKAFNNNFALTNRGDFLTYGTVARRVEPLTAGRFLAALAYIPGEGVCRDIFGEEKCFFWSFKKSDELGKAKVKALRESGLRAEEVNKEIIRSAFKKILDNPAQYVLLWFMEGLKMFFWESTQIGFVSYPAVLTKLFGWVPLKDGLRLLMSVLTFVTLAYLAVFLFRERRNLFKPQKNSHILLFLSVLFIILFNAAYAVFLILPRYVLSVVPLYLYICAFVIQKIFLSRD